MIYEFNALDRYILRHWSGAAAFENGFLLVEGMRHH